MKQLMIIAIIVGLYAVVNADTSNDGTVFLVDARGVVKKNSSGSEKVIYRTDKSIRFRGIKVSPNGEYLAFPETTEGTIAEGRGYYDILPRNNLVICNTEGIVLYSIDDDARKLSWAPDGGKIAYITGTFHEGGRGFRPNGIYIFDLTDGNKKPISKDFPHESLSGCLGVGYDLNWAAHDGNIYIQDADPCGGNYMYDTLSGTTQSVPYKGIHFSPDGKYYLALIFEDGNYVYEAATNLDISDEVKSAMPLIPFSWVPDRDHHLLSQKTEYLEHTKSGDPVESKQVYLTEDLQVKERRFILYDVDKRQIAEEWVEKP